MTDTLADRNFNPGNLKDHSTGQFKQFASEGEGYAALMNDLQSKVKGTSTTGLNGNSTLYDFASSYAPSSDNNDPAQYTANLANRLGVRPDSKLSELESRIPDFAQAIAANEGYTGAKGFKATPNNQIGQTQVNQNTIPAPITPVTSENKPKTLGQNIMGGINTAANYISKPFEDVAAIPVQAGLMAFNKLSGKNIPDPYQVEGGLGGNKINPINTSEGLLGKVGSAGTIASEVATVATAGGLASILKGGSALATPVVKQAIVDYGGKGLSNIATASGKVTALTDALASAEPGEKILIEAALKELAPKVLKEAGVGSFSELNPILAKSLGIGAKALKYLIGSGLLIGSGVIGSDKIKGIVKSVL